MESNQNSEITEPTDGLDIEFSIDAIEDVVDTPVEEVKEDSGKEEKTKEPEVKLENIEESTPEPAKEEVTEEPTAEVENDSVVSEIISKLGYDIEGEYEDTPEGIVELTKTASEKMAEETLENIFSSHPTVKQHLDFVMAGGDPNKFMSTQGEVTYETLEIKETDVKAQKEVLKSYFKTRGDEESFIDDMIETYEDKDQLFQKANQAKSALAKAQTQRKQQLLEGQREEAARQKEAAQQTWSTVKDTVSNASDLSGIPISQRDKSKFIDYISKPITRQGHTQRDLDAQKLGLEQQIAMDFFLYKGGNMKDILNKKANTSAAKSLKERLKSSTGRVKGGKSNPGLGGNISSEAIDNISTDGLF